MECEKHCEIAVGLQEIDSRSKSNVKRLDKLDERMDKVEDVTASIAILAENQKHMDGDLKEIKADVKTLAEKPGKKWDKTLETIGELLIAAIIGFALARIGLG